MRAVAEVEFRFVIHGDRVVPTTAWRALGPMSLRREFGVASNHARSDPKMVCFFSAKIFPLVLVLDFGFRFSAF